jgi:monofunctional chorismate mutase
VTSPLRTHTVPDLEPAGGWTDAARIADIERLRASIDNMDSALVHLLAERFKLTTQVGRHKKALDWPTSTKDREIEQITRLRALAAANGLDPDVEERFLAFLVGEVLEKHAEQRRPTGADAPRGLKVSIPVLESERLWYRPFVASDWETMCTFFADAEASQYVGGQSDPNDVWWRLTSFLGQWCVHGHGQFAMVEKTSGDFIGHCGTFWTPNRPEPEIGYAVFPAYRRRGFAAEAVERVLSFVYGELGWTTAVSYIDANNQASIGVAERVGARLDGRHQFTDWEALVYRHRPPAYQPPVQF